MRTKDQPQAHTTDGSQNANAPKLIGAETVYVGDEIGAYTDVEPVELERRPNPRKAPAVAARLVIGVVLAVIAAIAPKAAPAARLAAMLLSAGVAAAQLGAGYGRREFIHDQWPLVLVLAPCWAFLIWLAVR
jgi:hypothetical protein